MVFLFRCFSEGMCDFKMRNYKKGAKVSFLFKLRGKRRPSFEIKEGIGSGGRGRF
jgi:hypothetical protein